jgi:hypothetical protein
MIVARPRAVPIPLPFIAFGPLRLNLEDYSVRKEIAQQPKNTHGSILEHIWNNKESDHTPPNVNLI